MLNSQFNHLNIAKDTLSIGVGIDGLSNTDTEKVKKILKLSENRKRKYHFCDNESNNGKVQILLTVDPKPEEVDGIVAVTFGREATSNPYHLQPPLMSIRVLRILDSIQTKNYLVKVDSSATTKINPVATEPRVVRTSQRLEKAPSSVPEKAKVNNFATAKIKTKLIESKLDSVSQAIEKTVIPVPVSNAVVNETAADESEVNYRVLIVDDSVLIHKALDIELDQAEFGTKTDYAESGEACLEKVAQNKYDLIFLDVMMPGIDGFETCTEIRKNPAFKKTPIIMLSSKTSPLDEVKGVMAGCTTYLTKPIKHEEFQKLLGRMSKWLENYKSS